MAKTTSAKVGNTTVKNATAADLDQIKAGKAAAKADARAPVKPIARPADKAATKPDSTRLATPADETPDAKAKPSEKTAAAKKMFANADEAARAGFPPDLTVEQHENMQRRGALGY